MSDMTDLLDKAGALSAPEQLELAELCRQLKDELEEANRALNLTGRVAMKAIEELMEEVRK